MEDISFKMVATEMSIRLFSLEPFQGLSTVDPHVTKVFLRQFRTL
jgi:hypothetical protein